MLVTDTALPKPDHILAAAATRHFDRAARLPAMSAKEFTARHLDSNTRRQPTRLHNHRPGPDPGGRHRARDFQEPKETFTVPVPVPLARCAFCRFFTTFLQSIGEQYSATRQDQVIFFETDDSDLLPTKGWKAIPSALDRNQPTTTFLCGNQSSRENPLTDRSSVSA